MNNYKVKKVTSIKIQNYLAHNDISIFSKKDFIHFFNTSNSQTNRAIHGALKDEVIDKIKGGLYFLKVKPPSSFEIANFLYCPSYISLETALSYYRIIPENVYSTKSITTKHSKNFIKFNKDFSYSKINKNLFFGYKKIIISGRSVLIAEKEKAFMDYLYFVVLGLKRINDRFDFSKLDKEEIKKHLPLFIKTLKGKKAKAFNNLIEKFI